MTFLFAALLLCFVDIVWWESDLLFRFHRSKTFDQGSEDHRLEIGFVVARALWPIPDWFTAKVLTCRLCFRLWVSFLAVLLSLVVPEPAQQALLLTLGPWVILNVLRPA